LEGEVSIEPVPERLLFRYLPGFFPLTIALGTFFVYGFHLVLHVGYQHGWLLDAIGILAVGLGIVSNLFIWTLVRTLWETTWKFTFTLTQFIAVHPYRRKHLEIPWQSITRVTKLRRSWWNGRGGVAFSQIETAEGQHIQFRTDMLRYRKFLEELKARATNCGTFKAYRDEWEHLGARRPPSRRGKRAHRNRRCDDMDILPRCGPPAHRGPPERPAPDDLHLRRRREPEHPERRWVDAQLPLRRAEPACVSGLREVPQTWRACSSTRWTT